MSKTASKQVIKLLTTAKKSHVDHQKCVAVKQALKARNIEFQEVVFRHISPEDLDLVLIGWGGAELPVINVKENGRTVRRSFGYDSEFIESLAEGERDKTT